MAFLGEVVLQVTKDWWVQLVLQEQKALKEFQELQDSEVLTGVEEKLETLVDKDLLAWQALKASKDLLETQVSLVRQDQEE